MNEPPYWLNYSEWEEKLQVKGAAAEKCSSS